MNELKTMEDFISSVKTSLAEAFPVCKVSVKDITKNNGVCLSGIAIQTQDTGIAPVIYLEPYFSKLQAGTSLTAVLDEITNNYKAALKNAETTNTVITNDFSMAKDRICFQPVNKELNSRMLSGIPHRELYGLALIYYIKLDSAEESVKTVKVTNSLANLWGADEDQIYRLACKNTPKLNRGCVIPVSDVMDELMGAPLAKDTIREKYSYNSFDMTIAKEGSLPIYIATNKNKINGAGVILYDGLLEAVADKIGGFFVLPSSIHECLLVPGAAEKGEDMLQMVNFVNGTEVPPEDVLSGNCFYYNNNTHKLEIIAHI